MKVSLNIRRQGPDTTESSSLRRGAFQRAVKAGVDVSGCKHNFWVGRKEFFFSRLGSNVFPSSERWYEIDVYSKTWLATLNLMVIPVSSPRGTPFPPPINRHTHQKTPNPLPPFQHTHIKKPDP